MSETNRAATPGTEVAIVIERVIDAPRTLVWKAWTESEHIAQWWGPKGFATRVEQNDVRVGGRTRYVMIGPDGNEYPGEGVFREIVPLERIVTTDEFGDEHPGFADEDLPRGIVLTVLFEDLGERTRVTLNIAHTSAEERRKHEKMGVVAGWNSSLDCLAEHLKTMARS